MADPGEQKSENIHRNTPQWIVDLVRRFAKPGKIGLDPCSNATSLVRARVEWRGSGPSDDGLRLSWQRKGLVFVNPPYGDAIGDWMDKCRREAQRGAEIVALVPSRTGSRWWQRAAADASGSLRGRLTFPPCTTPAKFDSALLYWGKRRQAFVDLVAEHCTATSPAPTRPQLELAPRGEEQPLAILYNRATTDGQDPEWVMSELLRAATARGYRVRDVHRIVETGNGHNNDRPGLRRVLELARAREAQAVVVWKVDRFARSALDLLGNVRVVNDAGLRFVATQQGLDIGAGGDPVSKMQLTMLAAVAEFETSLIVDRTRSAVRRRIEQGLPHGRPSTITEEDLARVRELLEQKLGQRRLASQLRWPRAKVRRALHIIASARPTGDDHANAKV